MTGRIIKALAGFYYVEDHEEIVQCRARGKFRKNATKPLVGDFVEYKKEGQDGYILKIKKRKNSLVRPPIANIDQAILVFSSKEPDFSTSLLDKFLMQIEYLEIEPIIVISKMDLADDNLSQYIDYYRNAGYTVLPVSSHLQEGLEPVKEIFKDKVSVITGQSGVGKSSLLNALDIRLNLETNEISKALGRGKHTTRHVELLKMYGGYVADTPGFSSLELHIDPDEAYNVYRDFKKYSVYCKYHDCKHLHEPVCGIKQAVEDGDILKERYDHYVMFIEEMRKFKEKEYD